MTESQEPKLGVKRCEFCWNPYEGQHNEGCPELIGTPEAMAEWTRGRREGFSASYDEEISWRDYHRYPSTFIYGYRVGQAELEVVIEDAHDDDCNQRIHERKW